MTQNAGGVDHTASRRRLRAVHLPFPGLRRHFEIVRVGQDLPSLGYAYALCGQKGEAQRVLEQMRQNPITTSFDVAIVNVGLGRMAEALDGLEQAYRERIPWLMFIRVDGRLARLRGDPRFEALATAMNIPRR